MSSYCQLLVVIVEVINSYGSYSYWLLLWQLLQLLIVMAVINSYYAHPFS